MSKYDKFYAYLSELLQNYQNLSVLLRDKLVSVERFDLDQLDRIMNEEQVFVLLAKGFDQNIQNFRETLELKGDRLSVIIPELPEEEQQRFYSIFKELESTLAETKALNDKCQDLISERLHSLEQKIKNHDKSATAAYAKPGGTPPPKAPDKPRFLKKSI